MHPIVSAVREVTRRYTGAPFYRGDFPPGKQSPFRLEAARALRRIRRTRPGAFHRAVAWRTAESRRVAAQYARA